MPAYRLVENQTLRSRVTMPCACSRMNVLLSGALAFSQSQVYEANLRIAQLKDDIERKQLLCQEAIVDEYSTAESKQSAPAQLLDASVDPSPAKRDALATYSPKPVSSNLAQRAMDGEIIEVRYTAGSCKLVGYASFDRKTQRFGINCSRGENLNVQEFMKFRKQGMQHVTCHSVGFEGLNLKDLACALSHPTMYICKKRKR